jgi:hypothetical protein
MNYFPNATLDDNPVWKLVRNPFNIDVNLFLGPLQEQASELKSDSSAKYNF